MTINKPTTCSLPSLERIGRLEQPGATSLPANLKKGSPKLCDTVDGAGARHGGPCIVTEDELAGNCDGWDGTTIFTLTNGEVWQQSRFRSRQLHLCSPAIRVWRFRHSFWLEVEGIAEILPVQRVF